MPDSAKPSDSKPNSAEPSAATPGPELVPFLLTGKGTLITIVAIVILYLIVMTVPAFAMAFGEVANRCTGESALICSAAGERAARLAPSTGATLGLLIAGVGCFLPSLRNRRLAWLLAGYGCAMAGIAIGFLIASTGP
ncbi:MAG: hypothetical protein JXA67_15025 [Micromonosporaceae bacterium]|nr:hypothetical protein [Micromonosporaceae bacterium]